MLIGQDHQHRYLHRNSFIISLIVVLAVAAHPLPGDRWRSNPHPVDASSRWNNVSILNHARNIERYQSLSRTQPAAASDNVIRQFFAILQNHCDRDPANQGAVTARRPRSTREAL